MEISFYARLPESKEDLDVEFAADLYFSDDPETPPITATSQGLSYEDFKEQVYQAIISSMLEATDDVLIVDGEKISFDSDEDVFAQYMEEDDFYLDVELEAEQSEVAKDDQ